MIRATIFLVAIAVAAAMPVMNNTSPADNALVQDPWNIIGGKVVNPPFKYPFLVALVQRGQTPMNGQFCGASLIAADTVLTAAHCCDAVAADKIDTLIHWQDLSKTTQGERVQVKSMKIHPQYDAQTIDYDACVLKLSKKVSYTPVDLDDGSEAKVGNVPTVAGWGNTKTSGSSFPKEAMEVQVPIVSNTVCNAPESYAGAITPQMMCAGYAEGGKDSCQGDSGGPLFIGNTQVGIVSWGYACASKDHYGVYARVSVLKSWIESQIAAE